MKIKMMGILSIALLALLTVGAVCAADDNATDEIMGIENSQESDAISLEQPNNEQVIESDSNQTINSDAQSNDLLGISNEEQVLTSSDASPVLGATVTPVAKLTATKETQILKKSSSIYKTFKGKSKYTWKIKKTTWNKMKKQAIKVYKQFRRCGSYHPGYSNGVKVILKKGGHKYRGTAYAVKNSRGIRCEVRGLPHGVRATTWGDY